MKSKDETMKERSRYRLTGAVFIIALAVIFLPMLFDAEGLDPVGLEPLPEFEIEERNFDEIPTESIQAAQTLRKKIDRDGYNLRTGVRTGDPQFVLPSAVTPANGAGWGVQVGSFSKEKNAQALRDELISDGYHVALSHLRKGAEISTRVAVGPIIEEAQARELQKKLSRKYEEQSILVRFGY